QTSAAGSYSSTVPTSSLPSLPPTAYSLPFDADARASPLRGTRSDARSVQRSATGSYSSTEGSSLPLAPPTAYSLPLDASASPKVLRGVCIGALGPQVVVAGS